MLDYYYGKWGERMTYIFLVAGKGLRLHPLTLKHPKSLYKLDEKTTILQRMINLIKKCDENAEIVVVTGFMSNLIQEQIDDVIFINNPFYEVTNSIASLWFARHYLDRENVTIINGDVVMSEDLVQNIMCKSVDTPFILLDSSIKTNGDYNVQISQDKVLVMSKELDEYYGEYAGVSKLNYESAILLRNEIQLMIQEGMYDQWYENALVQMIFRNNFNLYYKDISEYNWTEVDSVNDLIYAKRIHLS